MKKLTAKAFAALAVGCTLLILLVAAGLNYAVDPLLHFHRPWFGLQPVLTNARYQNAGVIRNLEYDNLILGNSMCENFDSTWFDELWCGTTVKAPISGACAINWIDELALAKERSPKYILMNYDYDLLSLTPDRANYTLPDYLYDSNPINDVKYLLNLDILAEHTIPCLQGNLSGNVTDLHTAYEWAGFAPCGKEYAIQDYLSIDQATEITYTPEQVIHQVRFNLGLLEPYFREMPDTQFVFFGSPWSMLYWTLKTECGEMEAVQTAYREGLSILTAYDNVTVFFWDDEEILSIAADLDNYRDISHYSKDISRMLVRRMAEGVGLMTRENYAETVDNYFRQVRAFPFDTLFEE